jgi:uncharacterized protein YbjQ (UPF0145 family)/DNA-directed RNA polymerase subunit RPC12/RpoP
MEKVVYYCPNCGKTVSRLKGNKDNCSNCNGKMIQTPIDVEEWKALTDEKKESIKLEISSYGVPEYSGEPLSDLKHRHDLIQIQKIFVTTTDIKREYDIIGPVFYQINDAGSGKMIFQKQKEYRSVINALKDQNQLVNQNASITESIGALSGMIELFSTGDISASTKDLLGNGHNQFDEAFFISVEEIKKRAYYMGADAIIGMKEELNLDTNGFQHFYMQMYGTAVKFK